MKGIATSKNVVHLDVMLEKHIRTCAYTLRASKNTRVFTLAGSVKTGSGGLALCSNSPRIFMRLCASTALRRRLFEVSSWSPKWTTLVATYVIRSSNTWNSLKASCSGKICLLQQLHSFYFLSYTIFLTAAQFLWLFLPKQLYS